MDNSDAKLGIVFDEIDSQKLHQLIQYYEIDAYNLLANTIDTLWEIMEEQCRNNL